ncbi:lysine--tRNA ligase [Helicobacter sp. 16-1353]|uniref:lysine--tRNA ligase n=1 Tax=Helicobacter sp. 16-1353 TaxID=2004996 RepID=UPI000DCDF7D1|nr:lysine--tRNA ligase [Helicobacter sp. 16-1353]RAX54464.1 lysine--tRNA ligase [Helicobacter sp. 16-1353]
MFSNIYIQQRIQKAENIRESGGNPYDNNAKKTILNADFLEKYQNAPDSASAREDSSINSIRECVAGRVKLIRLMGKAAFMDIEDESGILQVYISKNDLESEFEAVKKTLEVGDIVNISGYPFKTKTNQLSLHAMSFKILTKSIIPLPEKFHGLVDIELRYRQRYLDMIMNSDVRGVFRLRSKVISLLRRFFENKGFLEVETPMLHPIPGGANAKPFITHHNALNVERYLRIAPELYLKRLIVGGFESVFEINRSFRNEGIDHSHNPEFTMIEFYWAYKNYNDLMDLTIELFSYLLDSLKLPKVLKWGENEIDFNQFNKMSYKDSLHSIGGIPQDIIENKEKLESFLKSQKIEVEKNLNYGKILGIAFDNFVESKLIAPTFIYDFPIEISPLARKNDKNPNIADRFELFIGGKEIANGFSELNDPLDQMERFKSQVAEKEKGDEEAQYMDEDYLWALGYGMPPVAGQGIGIDRLVMLLSGEKSIKDVILFPAMKPQKNEFNVESGESNANAESAESKAESTKK